MFTKKLLLLFLALCVQQTSASKRLQDPKKLQQSAAMAIKQQRRFAQRAERMEREAALKQHAQEIAAHAAQKKHNEHVENLSKTARELYCTLIRPHVQEVQGRIASILGFEFDPSIPLMRTYGDGASTDLLTILTETLPEETSMNFNDSSELLIVDFLNDAGVALGKVWALQALLIHQSTKIAMQRSLLTGEFVASRDIEGELLAHYPQHTTQQKDWVLQEKVSEEKDSKIAIQLIEEGINNNSEKAAAMKFTGLWFGTYGYTEDKAAANQLCETYVKLGHNWAIGSKLDGLKVGGSGYEKNEKEYNDFMNKQLAHNNDEAMQINFLYSLPENIESEERRQLEIPYARLGKKWAFSRLYGRDAKEMHFILLHLFNNLLAERKRVISLMHALQTVNS